MKSILRTISAFLASAMIITLIPANVFAEEENPYLIKNDYISYSINPETGGFSVITTGGHPQKQNDDNIPLLFEDIIEPSVETSFTTIKIGDDEFIFGRDYDYYGIDTTLSVPLVSDDGRQIQVVWTILGFEVTQHAAISLDDGASNTGNIAIRYTVKNNNGTSEDIGIRVLFDTSLGEKIDAPLFTVDGYRNPILHETVFSDANIEDEYQIPDQLRGTNSLNEANMLSYFIFEDEMFGEDIKPDKIILGHWASMANTRYDYNVNLVESFATSAGNNERTADNAVALYWEENLQASTSMSADILYGIGNFVDLSGEAIYGMNVTLNNAVEIDKNSPSQYKDNGEFNLTLEIDNTVDGATELKDLIVTIILEEGLDGEGAYDEEIVVDTDEEGNDILEKTGKRKIDISLTTVEVGEVHQEVIKLSATEANLTTAKLINIQVASTSLGDKGNASVQKFVLLPGTGSEKPKISIDSINPETVYFEGDKTINVLGDMSELRAIYGSSGWDVYLTHTQGSQDLRIPKDKIVFVDEDMSTMNLFVTETLVVGEYNVEFRFTDADLIDAFGEKITSNQKVTVSSDEKYKLLHYGTIAVVRDKSNAKEYRTLLFPTKAHFENYVDGYVPDKETNGIAKDTGTYPSYASINGDSITASEIIMILQGDFRQTEANSYNFEASTLNGDIIINNILKYTGDTTVSISQIDDFRGVKVSGDGELTVINSVSVWGDVPWEIILNKGTNYTLDMDKVAAGSAKPVKLEVWEYFNYLKANNVHGYTFELSYGLLSKSIGDANKLDDEFEAEYEGMPLYGISFGGKIGLPMNFFDAKVEGTDAHTAATKETNENAEETKPVAESETPATPEKDIPKGSIISDQFLVVDIDDVRFGQRLNNPEDTGFVGIAALLEFGLPQGTFDAITKAGYGFNVKFRLDTFEDEYDLSTKIDLVELCKIDFTLNFKGVLINSGPAKGNYEVIPDDIVFSYSQALDPAAAFTGVEFVGANGGIRDLADHFDTNIVTEIPKTTYELGLKFRIAAGLNLDITGNASPTSIKLDGTLTDSLSSLILPTLITEVTDSDGDVVKTAVDNLIGAKWEDKNKNGKFDPGEEVLDKDGNIQESGIIKGTVSLGFDWKDDVIMDLSGSVDILSGVISGKFRFLINFSSLSESPEIYIFISAAIKIPTIVPLIGDLELTKVEVAGSSNFIGANLTVMSFPLGIKYDWNEEDIDWNVTGHVNLNPPADWAIPASLGAVMSIVDENGAPVKVTYGSNVHTLAYMQSAPSMDLIETMSVVSEKSIYLSEISDNLLFTVPYTYDGAEEINVDSITVIAPDGMPLALEQADLLKGTGTFSTQEMQDGSNYIYFSVPHATNAHLGTFTVRTSVEGLELLDITAQGVLDVASIEGVSANYNSADPFAVDVSWVANEKSTKETSIALYLTENANIIADIKENGLDTVDLGVNISESDGNVIDFDTEMGTLETIIPPNMNDGTYHVLAVYVSGTGGVSYALSSNSFEFSNPNLPIGTVDNASLTYGGNGNIYLNIFDEDSESADYTHYRTILYKKDMYGNYVDLGEIAAGEFSKSNPDFFTNYIQEGEGKQYLIKTLEPLETGETYVARVVLTNEVYDRKGEYEASYMSREYYQTAPFTLPEKDAPVLLSVETNIDEYLDYEAPINVDTLEATYKFDRPVKFEYLINGTEYSSDVYSEEARIVHELNDGAVETSFKAYGLNEDYSTDADFLDVKGSSLGFKVDTSAPVLMLHTVSYEGIEGIENSGTAVQNTFMADEHGNYTIYGLTNTGAIITVNGEEPESLEISADGNFELYGTIKNDYGKETLEIKASDTAGNAVSVVVTVIREDYNDINDLEIYAVVTDKDGLVTDRNLTINEIGQNYIEIYPEDRIEFDVFGVTSRGNRIRLKNDEIVWNSLYEANNLSYNGESFEGVLIGETALVVGKIDALVIKDNKAEKFQSEEYVIVNVKETSKALLEQAILEAEELLALPLSSITASEEEQAVLLATTNEAKELVLNPSSLNSELDLMTEKLNDAISLYKKQASRVYPVSIEPFEIIIPAKGGGYVDAETVTATITNISEAEISNMVVTLIGDNAEDFVIDISETSSTLLVDGETTFKITPKSALGIGAYNAKVMVEVPELETRYANVSFIVKRAGIGDIDQNGVINISDVDRLFQFVQGETSDITLEIGDLNGDLVINISDVSRLFDHVNGSNPIE